MKTMKWGQGLILGAVTGLMFAGTLPAMAQQEGIDILFDVDSANNVVIKPQEPGTNPALLFNRTLNFFNGKYVHDLGFDVFPGIDSDITYATKKIKSLRIQQVAISPELSGIYQYTGNELVWGTDAKAKKNFLLSDSFAGGADGYRLFADDYNDPSNLVDPNDITQGYIVQPTYYHQHFDMQTNALGNFFFDIRVTEVTLNDGTLAPNSGVFRINFTNVPEPGTWALLVSGGLVGAGALRRRRK